MKFFIISNRSLIFNSDSFGGGNLSLLESVTAYWATGGVSLSLHTCLEQRLFLDCRHILASQTPRPFMTLPLRCAVSWKSLFKGAASGIAAARLMLLAQLPTLCPKVRLYALVQPGPFPAYGFSTSVHPTTAVQSPLGTEHCHCFRNVTLGLF